MSNQIQILLSSFARAEVSDFILMSKSYYQTGDVTDECVTHHKFVDAPYKCFHLTVAKNAGSLGRAVLAKRMLPIRSQALSVTQVSDLLVNKNAANIYSISSLVKNYKSLETDIVIHTSNEQSQDLYEKFFKLTVVFECQAKGFALRLVRPITKFFGTRVGTIFKPVEIAYRLALRSTFRIVDLFSPMRCREIDFGEFKEHLQAGRLNLPTGAMDRSLAYYRWRFFNHPLGYKCITVERRGQIASCFFVRQAAFGGLNAFLLMEVLLGRSSGRKTSSIRVAVALLRHALETDSDIVFTVANFGSLFLDRHITLPLLKIPNSALPHPTKIFLHKPRKEFDIESLKSMHFTLADLDYF